MVDGFSCFTASANIKDESLDFSIVLAQQPCVASAVFTNNTFAGASVKVSRDHIRNNTAQAIITISKNANVATGKTGQDHAKALAELTAQVCKINPADVLVASTGVIGVEYPWPKIEKTFAYISEADFQPLDLECLSEAIMTTDTKKKIAQVTLGNGVKIAGVAKGVGMIEPNMATMLSYIFTDAKIDSVLLDATFKKVVEQTYNSLTIDSDESTSDTATIMASGMGAEITQVNIADFEAGLLDVCASLVKQITQDGEGSSKAVIIKVQAVDNYLNAKIVAKSIANSPLVKTAIWGGDPNWGRIAMAIGKTKVPIDSENVSIHINDLQVYPKENSASMGDLEVQMQKTEIEILVLLNTGNASATVYTCDLTPEYVRFNGEYTS